MPSPSTKTAVGKDEKENIRPASGGKKPGGSTSTALTVGFSGTNDNKTLLPLNVLQNDLPG